MKKPLLFSFIIFIITLFFLAKFAWPSYQDLRELNFEIKNKETEVKDVEKYLTRLAEVFDLLEEKEIELAKVDSALPKNPNLAVLFDFIQKSASANGLILEKVDILSTANLKEREDLKETSAFLRFSGAYSDFKKFLPLLEKSTRIIEVEEILLSSGGEEKKAPFFELKIKVYSY